MPEALTSEGRILLAPDAHPLVVYAMSEAHPDDTRRIIAEEEEAASALIGAEPCSFPRHDELDQCVGPCAACASGYGPACPECGAAV